MTTTAEPRRIRRLSQTVRSEIVAYLVKQEQPADQKEAMDLAIEWNKLSDHDLIAANNYNRSYDGLPARKFAMQRRKA